MSFSKTLPFSSDPSSITSFGITLMLMLMGFIYYFYTISSSNSSAPSSSLPKRFTYDLFISFSGQDIRKTFFGHLCKALDQKNIKFFKDDEKMKQGETIDTQLIEAIRDSRFFFIIFSKNYASSSWCLNELLEIMECHNTGKQKAFPIFFDVEPTQVRKQSGAVGEAFAKHEKEKAAKKWRRALKKAAGLVGMDLSTTTNGHEAEFIEIVVSEISQKVRSINSGIDEEFVGITPRVNAVVSSLEMCTAEVRVIGMTGMRGGGKTATARAVYEHLFSSFEVHAFVQEVGEVSKCVSGLETLQSQVLSSMLNEQVTVNGVLNGIKMIRDMMYRKKVLLVFDHVEHIEQLEALAVDPKLFKSGSIIIITTTDEQVLEAYGVHLIHEIKLLSDEEAICLLSRRAFKRENPLPGYEELSKKVVCYAAGVPFIVRVLGTFLCGKSKLGWVDAINRLETIPIPFNEILERLKLSYTSLENDFQKIFLDIACILKGEHREYAIRVLECCGLNPITGLKVLQQRSLITISKDEILGMHKRIEELGKVIVRSPDEPNQHTRLYIKEEIEDILLNDMGTKKTQCLKFDMPRGNPTILMKGFGKMDNLRYLDLKFTNYDSETECESDPEFDDTSQYFPNSLKYLKCSHYPFLYLPKTFKANNLVGLEIYNSKMVRLWKEGEEKDLKNLKFLSLCKSNLTYFDIEKTPSLETLILRSSDKLVKLNMPVSCQKLKHLHISDSKLTNFDLGLTPNLKTFSLDNCADLVELHVSVASPKSSTFVIQG